MSKSNPRTKNGAKRRAIRRWVLATYTHCHLCGGYVDKSLPWNHPMAPEVDEIIPVSKGGSPVSKQNCKLAHRICNQRRGNKALGQKKIKKPVATSQDWKS